MFVSASPSISPLVDRLCARFPDRDEGLGVVTDLIVLIAAADAIIDDTEKRVLAESIETLLSSQIAPRLLRTVVDESRLRIRGLGPELSADAIGRKLAARQAAEDGLRLAIYIAAVSEGVSFIERKRIERLAVAAGVPAARLEGLFADPFAF